MAKIIRFIPKLPLKRPQLTTVWQILGAGLLAMPLLSYGSLQFSRPPLTNAEHRLFEGITYQRTIRSTPRPQVIHTVEIDLQTAGLNALVSMGNPGQDEQEFQARTTSAFVQMSDAQLAVNASFFHPFAEDTPWRYFPHSGDRVNALGQVISNGQLYSPDQEQWPVLCFMPESSAQIVESGTCSGGTVQAVAGRTILVSGGISAFDPRHPKATVPNRKPYARVAVGLNVAGDRLWLVVVDGKQPFYSQGVTEAELADIFVALGADVALNLDGGGSTTLAIETPSGPKVLNAPIHTKLPMRERPVANHLGFYTDSR